MSFKPQKKQTLPNCKVKFIKTGQNLTLGQQKARKLAGMATFAPSFLLKIFDFCPHSFEKGSHWVKLSAKRPTFAFYYPPSALQPETTLSARHGIFSDKRLQVIQHFFYQMCPLPRRRDLRNRQLVFCKTL